MGFFKDLRNNIAFLTRLPIGNVTFEYEDLAHKTWIFPIVGFIIGLIVGVACLILFRFLPGLIVGFIALGLLIYITGAHHTDGLLDFGDGLMASGTPEHKIEVMHDVSTGTGGFVLAFFILILTGLGISFLPEIILISLIVGEVGAKFAMVAACATGKSAGTKLADPFIKNTTKRHLVIALALSIGLIYGSLWLGTFFEFMLNEWNILRYIFLEARSVSPLNPIHTSIILAIFLIGTLIPVYIMNKLANRNFNGLTGDCLGALNEITRAVILIIFVLLASQF